MHTATVYVNKRFECAREFTLELKFRAQFRLMLLLTSPTFSYSISVNYLTSDWEAAESKRVKGSAFLDKNLRTHSPSQDSC